MGKTFAEKILAQKAGLEAVVPGQIVTVQPDRLLTHDNTSAIAKTFRKFGVDRVKQVLLDCQARQAPAAAVLDSLLAAVRDHATGVVQRDDMTLVVVRRA